MSTVRNLCNIELISANMCSRVILVQVVLLVRVGRLATDFLVQR